MRIAMVSEHASPLAVLGGADAGGQNVHVASLSQALAALGHQVFIYTRRDDPLVPERVPFCDGVEVCHLSAGPAAPIPKDDIFPHLRELGLCLQEALVADRPDVIHAHFWMSGLAALRAGRALSIPVLQTFHALGSVKRRHQGHRDTSPSERIASEVNLTRQVDRVVATCSDELFELSRLGADAERISIVPCGVDTEVFVPPGPGASSRTTGLAQLVSVGRLVERKGVDDIIRALPGLPEAELIVAGGPAAGDLLSDSDACRLHALAVELDVAKRVTLVGRLERAAVAALFRSADLAVCVPWYEPFGIVPLEAMACAVPVVAANVGGLSDTVVDGRTGVHVPARRPAALRAAIRGLLSEPALRRAMGAAGRALVWERYRWSSVASATVQAYERALLDGTEGTTHSSGPPVRSVALR